MLGGKQNPNVKNQLLPISAALGEENMGCMYQRESPIIHSKGKSVVMTSYVNKVLPILL